MDAPDNAAELIADFNALKDDIAFIRALRQLRVATATGDVTIQIDADSGNASLDLRSLTPTATPSGTQLPDQSGQSGKLLTTNGSVPAWG